MDSDIIDDWEQAIGAAGSYNAAAVNTNMMIVDPSQETEYLKPEGKIPHIAMCSIRTASGVATLINNLSNVVAAAQNKGEFRLVLQVVRTTAAKSQSHYERQLIGESTTYYPPSITPVTPFTVNDRKSIDAGTVGSLRLCTPKGVESVYEFAIDCYIPIVIVDPVSKVTKEPVPVVPIGLGPAFEVEASPFLKHLTAALNASHKSKGTHIMLNFSESYVTLTADKLQAKHVIVKEMDGTGTVTSVTLRGREEYVVPYSSHPDTNKNNQQLFRANTADEPISRPDAITFKFPQSDLASLRHSLHNSGADAKSDDTNSHVLLWSDFTFVPPEHMRDLVGWDAERVLSSNEQVGSFHGHLLHLLAIVGSDMEQSHSSQLVIPFDGPTPPNQLPRSAYAHFLESFNLQRNAMIQPTEAAEKWHQWNDANALYSDSIGAHEDICPFFYTRNRLPPLLSAMVGKNVAVEWTMPRGSTGPAQNTILVTATFGDNQPKKPVADGGVEDAEEAAPMSTFLKTSCMSAVSTMAGTPSVMTVTMYGQSRSTQPPFMQNIVQYAPHGNPSLRVTQKIADGDDDGSDLVESSGIIFSNTTDAISPQRIVQ